MADTAIGINNTTPKAPNSPVYKYKSLGWFIQCKNRSSPASENTTTTRLPAIFRLTFIGVPHFFSTTFGLRLYR
jgi:hypothetical protein